MEITPTTLILVGVVCVILGYLASVLLNTLADEGEAPTEGTDAAPPGGRKGRYTPVFRVWREKEAGTLVVEMDGKSMIAPDPLNAVQRERLERNVRDLRAWLGMGLPGTQAAQPEEAPAIQKPAAYQPASVPEIDLRRTLVDEPGSIPPVTMATVQQPVNPPLRAQVSSVPPVQKGKKELAAAGAAAVPAAAKAAPAAKSIVLQIEDILQDMIAGSELALRGVHLIEDPIKGVIVQVGLEYYEGIDSVPDPYIKGIIQSAVKEWENSQ